MITASEFAILQATDTILFDAVDDAQTIINRKNAQLIRLAAQVAALQRELADEKGKRKLAEYKLARRH